MRRLLSLALVFVAAVTIGCSKGTKPGGDTNTGGNADGGVTTPGGNTNPGGPPITEDELKAAVAKAYDIVSESKVKSVVLLSPLIPVSDKFYTTFKRFDRTAVACYTEIEFQHPAQKSTRKQTHLVAVGRDDGSLFAADRGKVSAPVFSYPNDAENLFGKEWATANPFKAKQSGK